MTVFHALCFAFLTASFVSSKRLVENSQTFLNGKVRVEWTHLKLTHEIQFKVTAQTKGYVALGISNFNSAMKNIDVMFGKVVGGIPSIEDRWVPTYGPPSLDSKQDVHLVSGSEANGETVLTFKRKLDTGDSAQDIKIEPGSSYYLAVAISSSDQLMKHTRSRRAYSSEKIQLIP